MRTLLMLAQWYPPCRAWPTAATRASLLATSLPAHGWRTVVLAPAFSAEACRCGWCGRSAPSPPSPPGTDVRRLETKPSTVRRLRALGRASSVDGATSSGEPARRAGLSQAAWLLSDSGSNWTRVVAAHADRILRGGSVDALWTTSGPYSHLRVGAQLARRHGVPWVADLRDPVSGDVTAPPGWVGGMARARRLVYRRPARRADAVTTAIHHVLEIDGPWLGQDPLVIPPGFDPDVWAGARAGATPSPDCFEIVYAGKLYETHQRLDLFLQGLRAAADRLAPEDRNRLRFVYYGRSGAVLRRLAGRHGCGDLVEDRGFADPASVPAVLAEASALLLLTIEAGDAGVPGGKLYDYLGAHRPILSVPSGGRRIEALLSETRAGTVADDRDAVAEQLLRWFTAWRVGGDLPFGGVTSAIERFSARASARRLAVLLDGLTERAGARAPGSTRCEAAAPSRVAAVGPR